MSERQLYYKALLKKDTLFEGKFFAGIATTGDFCHFTCPAKKPAYENCEFFSNSKQALLAGYRPCKCCNPLSNPTFVPEKVRELVDAVEENPAKKWKNRDFVRLSANAASADRIFHKKAGMTFVEYARARRLGIGFKEVRIQNAFAAVENAFKPQPEEKPRDIFRETFGIALSTKAAVKELWAEWIETEIGSMLAIADKTHIHLLEFVDRRGLENELIRLYKRLNAIITPGSTPASISIKEELRSYFDGTLTTFKTPIQYLGSAFQQTVWDALQRIPRGCTVSYAQLAKLVGKPDAENAVARANGMNQLAIRVPCHRVIGRNGDLGGYGGGMERKKCLLELEGALP